MVFGVSAHHVTANGSCTLKTPIMISIKPPDTKGAARIAAHITGIMSMPKKMSMLCLFFCLSSIVFLSRLSFPAFLLLWSSADYTQKHLVHKVGASLLSDKLVALIIQRPDDQPPAVFVYFNDAFALIHKVFLLSRRLSVWLRALLHSLRNQIPISAFHNVTCGLPYQ